jgi:hypothetical protein
MRFGARIFLLLTIAYGQIETFSQQTVSIKRLTSEVNFDGIPNEEAWSGQGFIPDLDSLLLRILNNSWQINLILSDN